MLREPFDIDQLMYCSLAAQPMSEEDINAIVQKAQVTNPGARITGTLMVHEGVFIQWIEGPRYAVDTLWRKLLKDSRHHCIVKLLVNKDMHERAFAGWTMKRVSRDEMLCMVEEARNLALLHTPTPWAPAIDALLTLLKSTEPREQVVQMNAAGIDTKSDLDG